MKFAKIQRFYQATVRAIKKLPTKPWNEIMHTVTILGAPVFVTITVLIMMIISLSIHKPLIGQVAGLIIVTHIINTILKLIFRRDRPDTDYAKKILFSKHSFPSGHSAVGLVTWYSLPLVLSSINVPMIFVLGLTILAPFVIFMIGISRVYLGAHYLTDVLAGWLLGIVCMISFILIIF